MRRERLARIILLLILIGIPIAILGFQRWLRPALSPTRVIDIVAAAPEAGGFQPGAFKVEAGETVTLRFSSVDVTHGIALGPGLGIDLGYVDPGHVKEVTLTFDRAGTYTFYCNIWCSPNHWRMRGILEVNDPSRILPTPQRDPVIEALNVEGVNIDADHTTSGMSSPDGTPVQQLMFAVRPSALRGATLSGSVNIPSDLNVPLWRRSHTPAQGLALLISANPTISKAEAADVVAYLWTKDASPATLASAALLYDKNCAACHGQTGDGKGLMAGLTIKPPAVFSDPAHMFIMRSDVLYAKIRRGGMGTDMPNFGTLFTPEETWALVNYLWALALDRQLGK